MKLEKNKIIVFITFILSLFLFNNCSKDFDFGDLKVAVKTNNFSNVLQTTASVSGEIIRDNGLSINSRGICYGTTSNPTIAGLKKTASIASLGSFSCDLDNLSPSTTYFARAYASNGYGTAYGTSISFTTQAATIPVLSSTTAASLISTTSVSTGGTIISNGASNVTSRGVCYSSTNNIPTIADTKTNNGTGNGTFISAINGLLANTTYYIRAYAINGVGPGYGDVKSFRTSPASIPSGITTSSISSISQTSCISGGTIVNDGGSAITSRGVCWSNTTTSPTMLNSFSNDGSGIGSFSSSLTNLLPGTTYYIRAYAVNSIGTAYANNVVTITTSSLTIGQNYLGGKVAYIFSSTDQGFISGQSHGLIVSTTDQSTNSQWGCSGVTIPGTNTVLGSGISNTTAIVNGCSTINIAAAICNNLSLGGYTDWYLPSSDELNKLYSNRIFIGGFSATSYWSSSQSSSTTAYSINFSNGSIQINSNKTSPIYVRAIRYF